MVALLEILPILSLKIIGVNTFCTVAKKDTVKVLTFLKMCSLYQFKVLTMISGVDYPHLANRFEISYELLSLKYNVRLRLKCFVNEIDQALSASSVYLSATWWEREIWDMFGVYFVNNPDLRRILTDYGFVGHPLRKDFPLTGFVETFYDSKTKMVSYGFTEVSQKQRVFVSYLPDLDD